MATEIVFRRPELDHLLNQRAGVVGKHLEAVGMKIEAFAKAKAGTRTGALKASIHYRLSRDNVGQIVTIGSDLKYALMHHEGTRPHIILPQRARVLRFHSGGRVIYSRMVRHPGTRANHYLTDGLYLIK